MFKKIRGLMGEKERELPLDTLESWADGEIERVRGEIADRSHPLSKRYGGDWTRSHTRWKTYGTWRKSSSAD
jgi:hypothetical protein